MQQLTRLCAALLIVVALAAPAWAQCRALYAAGNELWAAAPHAEAQRIVADERGIARARWSPSGDRIAYVQPFDLRGEIVSRIVVVSTAGEPLATLAIPADLGITDVLNFGWLDERHLWTEGHVTPSSGLYHEWDLASGRAANERMGAWFAPSPDGKSVAYREHVPHGAPRTIGDRVLVDDEVVYPPASDARAHHLSQVEWNDEGQLTLTDEVGGARSRIVVDDKRDRKPAVNSKRPDREPMYFDVATHRVTSEKSRSTVDALDVFCH